MKKNQKNIKSKAKRIMKKDVKTIDELSDEELSSSQGSIEQVLEASIE